MHGEFVQGDRVGVLLDLDAGWLRFYRNGERCGPGYTEGVTGPLVCAAQMFGKNGCLTVLPGAAVPEGAGAVDEPWLWKEPTAVHGTQSDSESEPEADY